MGGRPYITHKTQTSNPRKGAKKVWPGSKDFSVFLGHGFEKLPYNLLPKRDGVWVLPPFGQIRLYPKSQSPSLTAMIFDEASLAWYKALTKAIGLELRGVGFRVRMGSLLNPEP